MSDNESMVYTGDEYEDDGGFVEENDSQYGMMNEEEVDESVLETEEEDDEDDEGEINQQHIGKVFAYLDS